MEKIHFLEKNHIFLKTRAELNPFQDCEYQNLEKMGEKKQKHKKGQNRENWNTVVLAKEKE